MVDVTLLNSMYQDLVHEHNMLVDLVKDKEVIIQELLKELNELKQETHRTKEGAIVKLKDMTNLHILRYLRIKFENNYDDRDRFIKELLDRGLGDYGWITINDAIQLGFCDKGIEWAKNQFGSDVRVNPKTLLLHLLTAKEDLTYCVHIIDALIHFCYKVKIINETR